MNKLTVGADPELFLRNSSGFVSAVGLIGGTKQQPLPISKDGHCVQEDNVSVEFNIPPASSATEFVNHINFVLQHLEKKAASLNLQFAVGVAATSFPKKELMTPEAQTFGCEPDFNAYTLEPNPRPYCEDEALRSCGGHVHVGTDLSPIEVVRAMDYYLGIPSVVMDRDTKRRSLYGKAGSFRPKPYGVEYRTLSNFWLWKDEYKKWVYNQTALAVQMVRDGFSIHGATATNIQNIINNGDVDAARAMGKLDPRIVAI